MAQLEEGLKMIGEILKRHPEDSAKNAIDVLIHSLLSAEKEESEDVVQEDALQNLREYFDVKTEVSSVERSQKGKKNMPAGRIDAILTHKEFKDFVVGIEFKSESKKKGKDISHWLSQMNRYSFYTWVGYEEKGRIPIFSYPQISFNYLLAVRSIFTHDLNHEHNNVNSLIAKESRCGEIRQQQQVHANPSYTPYRKMFLSFKNRTFWREFGYGSDYVYMEAYRQIHAELNKN